MLRAGRTARQIITRASLENAIVAVYAVGGSTGQGTLASLYCSESCYGQVFGCISSFQSFELGLLVFFPSPPPFIVTTYMQAPLHEPTKHRR